MGIVREDINFERGMDPKRSMNIGLWFDTFFELGVYAFDHLEQVIGSNKLNFHKDDPNLVDISQYKKTQEWFKKMKDRVDPTDFKKRESEHFSAFWQGFIERYNETS